MPLTYHPTLHIICRVKNCLYFRQSLVNFQATLRHISVNTLFVFMAKANSASICYIAKFTEALNNLILKVIATLLRSEEEQPYVLNFRQLQSALKLFRMYQKFTLDYVNFPIGEPIDHVLRPAAESFSLTSFALLSDISEMLTLSTFLISRPRTPFSSMALTWPTIIGLASSANVKKLNLTQDIIHTPEYAENPPSIGTVIPVTKPVKNRHFALHSHEHYEIYMFISGDCKYIVEENTYPLAPHDLIIIKKHGLHRVFHKSATTYRRYVLSVAPCFFAENGCGDYERIFTDFSAVNGNKINSATVRSTGIYDAFLRMIKYYTQPEGDSTPAVKASVAELLHLISPVKEFSGAEAATGSIKDVIIYLNSHYTENIHLAALSERFFYLQISHMPYVQASNRPYRSRVFNSKALASRK